MTEETPQIQRSIIPRILLETASEPPVNNLSVQQQKQEQKRKEMSKKLEKILDHRDLAKERMLRIREGLAVANISIHWLRLQLETLRQCNDELQKTYLDICDLVPRDQREGHKQSHFQDEELHAELFVNIQSEIAKWNAAEEEKKRGNMSALAPAFVPQQPVVVNSSTPHLHVPLPTFDGSLENWYSFKCMFKTIMSRYPNESPAIKLYHLKNSLVGGAAGKIDQDVINNNDYESAWKMLEDTYEDERLIIDTHIDALLALPKMNNENGNELRNLLDICTKHVDALKNRSLPVEGLAEMILLNVIAKRLDKETRKLYESQIPSDELPTYTETIDFLRERSRILQKMKGYNELRPSVSTRQKGKQSDIKPVQSRNFVQTSNQSKESCACCGNEHLIYKCDVFKDMTISERYTKVKQTGLCFNCLRRGHRTGECNSDRTCKTCKRKHHSLLHENKTTAPQFGVSQSSAVTSSVPEEHCEVAGQAPGSVNCARAATTKQVLLSTGEVEVYGSGNNRLACRALLDSGSDSHLISEAFARKLNIPMERVNIPIIGVNNAATRVKHKLHTTISSRVNPFVVDLDFLVVPTITANLPITKVDVRSWIIPDNLALADPSFHTPDEIQMIIGAELFST
ncbi:uncharacterized protein LOC134221623 [Armigeres subalbatus]|uniref:uncharacterized protein LOC134221623 n=1 Tax=Armigeres subalbatus TaxID=124917 RepID=UPI002ED197C1